MPKLPDKRALGDPSFRAGGGVTTAKDFGFPYKAADFGGDKGLGALGAGLKQLGAGIESGEAQAEKDERFAALTKFDEFTTNIEMERSKYLRDMPVGADGFTQSWEDYSRPLYTEAYKGLPQNPKILREFDHRLQAHENNQKRFMYDQELVEQDRLGKFRLQERADSVIGRATPENLDEMRQSMRDYVKTARVHPKERYTLLRNYDKMLQTEALRKAEADALAARGLDEELNERHRKLAHETVPKDGKSSLARRRFQYDPELDGPEEDERVPPGQGGNMPTYPGKAQDASSYLKSKLAPGYEKRQSDVEKLHPVMQDRLAAFAAEAEANGHDIRIISGHRSQERQAVLWQSAVRRYGSEAEARKHVAPPGGSTHQSGEAVDLQYGDRGAGLGGKRTAAVEWAHKNAAKYGLHFPLGHEDWHVEPVEAREGGKRFGGQYKQGQPLFKGAVARSTSPQDVFGKDVDVSNLPAGMRNNNPGNIKFSGSQWQKANLPGIVGASENTDEGTPQIKFASPQEGMAASAKLALLKNREQGLDTIRKIIDDPKHGWTPGSAGRGAAEDIAKAAGVGPDDKIDLSDQTMMRKFLRGLITREHGAASKLYNDDLIDQGVRMAMGRPVNERGVMAPKQFAGVAQKGGTVTDVTPVELDPKTGQPLPQQAMPQAASSTLPVAGGDPGFYGQNMAPTGTGMVQLDRRGRVPVWHGEEVGTHVYVGSADKLPFNVRQASTNRVMTERNRAFGEIEADIKKYDEGAINGVAPPLKEVARLKGLIAKADDPYLKSRLEDLEIKAFGMNEFGKVVPELQDAEIARFEAANRDANGQLRLDEEQTKMLKAMKAVSNANRAAIAKNNLEWGHSKGHVKLEALDFSKPETIRKRMYASEEMANFTKKPGLLFTEEEESRFKALVDKGGKPMLQVFAAVTKETGDKAQRYLQQIAKTVPTAPWMGGLMLDAEKAKSPALLKAAEDAARGVELRRQREKDGIKVPYALKEDDPAKAARDIVTNEYADAFIREPIAKQGLVQMAEDIYEARASSRGLVTYNEALWKESLRAAAGEHTVNGVKYGGIVHQERGLWGGNAGRAIPVPVTMDQEKFLQVRDVLTQQDIEGTSWRDVMGVATTRVQDAVSRAGAAPGQPTVAGVPALSPQPESDAQPYYGPVYDTGKALTVSDFRRAKLIAIGEGQYIMSLGDPASDDPRLVKDGTGNNYVFDVNRFEDTLRKRRPDLYLDKEKKPTGMMKLGGPGSFSVGEAASPVEKTLYAGEESKTADHGMAAEAREMAKAHKSPREIFHATGWFQNKNGKWKSEIDDSKAEVFDDESELADFRGTKRLDEFFAHEDLYAALPELKDTPVEFVSQPRDRNAGWMDMGKKALTLNMPVLTKLAEANGIHLNEVIRSVVLHETQHLQQDMGGEGRAAVEEHVQKPYAERSHEKEAYDTQRRVNTPKAARRMIAPEAVIAADEEHVSRLARHTPNIAFDAQGRAVDTQWTTVSDKLDARKKKK